MFKISPIHAIRQKNISLLKTKISQKIEKDDEKFYSEYQCFEDVFNHERACCVADSLVNNKPETFSERKYLKFLTELYLGGINFRNIARMFKKDRNALSEIIFKKGIGSAYEIAKEKHCNQKDYINPTEETLRKDIDFENIEAPKKLTQSVSKGAFTKEEILSILEKSSHLTLDSGSLLKDYYDSNSLYDFPLLFASACYNSRNQGRGYIIDKIPQIFEGILPEEIITAMDLFSVRYKSDILSSKIKITYEIDGKKFFFEPLKSGQEARTFRISDDKNNTAVLKIFHPNPNEDMDKDNDVTFAPCGIYGHLGILREANICGVCDVPELYIANPIFIPVESKNSDYMGGWAIIEDADKKELREGLRLENWLDNKGLYLLDNKPSAWVKGICVDLGFVTSKENPAIYKGCWGDNLINQLFIRYLNYETTQGLIEFLKNSEITYTDDMNSR